MIAFFHFLIIISIAWLVFRKYGTKYPRVFWLSFLFKLSMGSALGLVYLYYYSANDTWLFFRDANALAQFGKSDFPSYLKFLFTDEAPDDLFGQLVNSQERSLFLIKFMSVFAWIGGNNYWISASYFSLISFCSAWYLFSVVTRLFEQSWLAAAVSFLFFPSIIFWSSGLVKETLALTAIYFVTGLFLKYIFNEKVAWYEWMLALCSFWVAWNLKYYWTALFGAVVFTYLLVHLLSNKLPLFQKNRVVAWVIIFVALCGGVSLLHPNFYLDRFLDVLITNHNDFIRISDDDGLIHFYNLHSSWLSVITNAPWALISGLLRPFLWEASGVMALLASLENLLITVLLLTSLTRITRVGKHRLLLLSACVYIACLCVFLALSTPNLGTLSRYRIGFLPFLIFILAYRNPLLAFLTNRFKILQS
jgi:hypothetical protein